MDKYKLDTLCVQAGYSPKTGQSRIPPIVQSTTFVYEKTQDMADLFDLKSDGYFYTRLANPTVAAFENKVAALEGGVCGIGCASGMSATSLAVFTVAGAGEVEQRDGVWYYVFTPVEKGVTEVTITGTPQGKTTPKGELKFSLNAVVKENPDVIVRNYTPDMEYSVGVSFRVDVAELFVYEGKEKLVYGTDRGKLETQNGKTYLVFTASQAGEVTVSVTAMPEGKEDKKVTNAIRLLFKAAPEKPGEQPPVYGPPEEQPSESSGCNSRVGGSAIGFAVLAAGAAVICLRRKKQL